MSEQMDIFEYATRTKLRLNFKGQISVEDLWDLSTNDLNSLYSNLRNQQKATEEESLISPAKSNKSLDVAVELVKHIFQVKIDEQNVKKLKAEKAAKRKRIREILAMKEDESLMTASKEELERLLAEED